MKKFLIVASLISAILLTGCGKKNEVVENVDVVNNTENEVQEENVVQNEVINNENEVAEAGMQDDLIIESMYAANIRIPKILLESEDAERVNKELEDMAEEEIRVFGEEDAPDINFRYSKNDNMLSILVMQDTELGTVTYSDNFKIPFSFYYAYNFDISTGKQLKNVEVMGEETAKDLLEKLPEIYGKEFDKFNKERVDGIDYDELRNKSISETPKDIEEVKYYLDEKEGPQMITRIEIPFQGGSTYVITNLNDYIK